MNLCDYRREGIKRKRSWHKFQMNVNTVIVTMPETTVTYRVYRRDDIKRFLTLKEYYAFNRHMGKKQYPLEGAYIDTIKSFIKEFIEE